MKQSEIWIAVFRIWTQIVKSISLDNSYTKYTSLSIVNIQLYHPGLSTNGLRWETPVQITTLLAVLRTISQKLLLKMYYYYLRVSGEFSISSFGALLHCHYSQVHSDVEC